MDFVYILFRESWNDSIIYLDQTEAIQASLNYPMYTVQMFTCLMNTSMKVNELSGIKSNEFVPTYNYFQNGKFY